MRIIRIMLISIVVVMPTQLFFVKSYARANTNSEFDSKVFTAYVNSNIFPTLNKPESNYTGKVLSSIYLFECFFTGINGFNISEKPYIESIRALGYCSRLENAAQNKLIEQDQSNQQSIKEGLKNTYTFSLGELIIGLIIIGSVISLLIRLMVVKGWIFLGISRKQLDDRTACKLNQLEFQIEKRRRIIKSFKENNNRLNFLLASSPVILFSCSLAEPYRLKYVTDNIQDKMGLDPQSLIKNKNFWSHYIHPDDIEMVKGKIKSLCDKSADVVTCEYRIKVGDKSYHWVLNQMKVLYSTADTPIEIIGFWDDINDQRIAETEVNIKSNRLQRGQHLANIGTWDWNIQTNELYWTEIIPVLFGYDAGELETSYDNFLAAIHPDDRQSVVDAIANCVENDEPYNIEHRVIWPNGRVVWLHERGDVTRDDDGNALHMLGVVENVDKRKRAEMALKQSQTKLSRLFELSPLGIALTDMNGNYLEYNKAFINICGYPEDELNKLDYWTLTPKEYESQEALQLESLEKIGRYGPYEKEYRQKNGNLVPIRLNGVLIDNDKGESQIWSIIEDITDSKEAAQQLLEAKKNAEHANKAKSEFLSSMSHELRTPLNAIIGFAQLFGIDNELNAEQKESADEIYKAGKHLLTLINEVLDLARIESGRIELSSDDVLLCNVLDECVTLIKPLAESNNLTLEYIDGSCSDVIVKADVTRLKQVILNLLSNAVKYNRKNGKISLSCATNHLESVSIHIQDTGYGISEENIQNLFQPFNRLGAEAEDIEGTGIGLVITKKLIEMMGGSIAIESTIDVGSTFSVELKQSARNRTDLNIKHNNSEADNEEEEHHDAVQTTNNYRILVAEDNEVNQILLRRQMKALNYNPEFVKNGVEALEQLKKSQYDILFTDLHMPLMGGYELTTSIRKEEQKTGKHLTIVAITASAMEQDSKRCFKVGMDGYVTKPISIGDLDAVLKEHLYKEAS